MLLRYKREFLPYLFDGNGLECKKSRFNESCLLRCGSNIIDARIIFVLGGWWRKSRLYQNVFRCQRHTFLIESTRFKSIVRSDHQLEIPLSVIDLLRWGDAKFVFMGDFSCTQKSTFSIEYGSEDQVKNSCSKGSIHSSRFIVFLLSANNYESR